MKILSAFLRHRKKTEEEKEEEEEEVIPSSEVSRRLSKGSSRRLSKGSSRRSSTDGNRRMSALGGSMDSLFSSSLSLEQSTRSIPCQSGSIIMRPRQRLSLMPVAQLRFESVGLLGRENEMDLLKEILGRIKSNINLQKPSSEIVLISGRAGTGKSSLISEFGKSAAPRKADDAGAALYAYGKFDSSDFGATKPFSAVVAALSELADQAIKNLEAAEGKEKESYLAKLKDVIGKLGRLMPDFDIPMHTPTDEGPTKEVLEEIDDNEGQFRDSERRRKRLHFLVRRLFSLVCTSNNSQHVILVLDDLQWADVSSLRLFVNLATDRDLGGLLLCGCYRDNEVSEDHPLMHSLSEIKKNKGFPVSHIHIGNLALDTVNNLISDLLSFVETKTADLASVVYEKTGGNPFFVKQFISALNEKKLLSYNVGTTSWVYDVEAIRSAMNVADNVKDLMIDTLKNQLPPEALNILQLAACLGSTFDEEIVRVVASSLSNINEDGEGAKDAHDCSPEMLFLAAPYDEERVTENLDLCVKNGLLLEIGQGGNSRQFKFEHDHIQDAAFGLSSDVECDLLSLMVGNALVKGLSEAKAEEYLFITVFLWNRGVKFISRSSMRRVYAAYLNLRAGIKAMEMAAFSSAVVFLQSGIEAIQQSEMEATCWISHKDLMVGLYTTLADAEFSYGDQESMRQCIETILSQEHLALSDQLPAHSTLLRSLGAQNRLEEALESSLQLLAKMGVRLPRKSLKFAIVWDLLKTKHLLSRHSISSLLELPEMEDFQKVCAMRIMDNLLAYAYAINTDLMVVTSLKMVRWSVKYGLCRHSPPVFAVYGMLMVGVLGKSKQGHAYGKLALSMVDEFGLQDVEARTIFIAHNYSHHWIEPLHENLKAYRRGYDIGLQTGDIEYAMLCIIYHCDEATNIGRPLSRVVSDLEAYAQQALDYGLEYYHNLTLPLLQYAMNLMGDCENPVVLTGTAMDQEELLATQNPFLVCNIRFQRMWLAVYFEEYSLAWEMAECSRDMSEIMIGRHVNWRSALFEGLAAFSLARKSHQKIWKRRAHRVYNRVKKWEKSGNVNCRHILCIFEAEKAAVEGKHDLARRAYRRAISTAAKMGFLNDGALFNERAGIYLLEFGDADSHYWAKNYLEDALNLYSEWEAWGKAEQLRKKYPDVFVQTDDNQ